MRALIPLVGLQVLSAPPGAAGEPFGPQLPVVGTSQAYELVPDLQRVSLAEDGRKLWSETITVEGASFLKIHFVNVNLRPGDYLEIRSTAGRVVERITGRGPKEMGTFWGLSSPWDTQTLEFSFARDYVEPAFHIDQLMVGDAALFDAFGIQAPEIPDSICVPPDFEDVICYLNDVKKWSNVQASVGVMVVGGDPNFSIFCSGSNISSDNKLLTNDHCVANQPQCDNAEFVFKFYRTDCNVGAPPTEDWQSFRCDQFLTGEPLGSCDAQPGSLDYSLFSVIGDPAAAFGWVQPDPTPLTDGEAIYIVQHPQGRPHEITHGSGADVDVDGTVLRYYNTLDTEGGSSGSPIFREADGKLVGLHHCGGCSTPGVGNRGMLMSDIFPGIQDFLPSIFVDGFESGDVTVWSEICPPTCDRFK